MAKNHMDQVAKILGVELEEKFKLTHCKEIYKFTKDGLVFINDECDKEWKDAPLVQKAVLIGKFAIEKWLWKPKKGDTYHFVYWLKRSDGWAIDVGCERYDEYFAGDTLRADIGNCFKTREEAEALKHEVFKRLTGKDWHEVYGKEGVDNENM